MEIQLRVAEEWSGFLQAVPDRRELPEQRHVGGPALGGLGDRWDTQHTEKHTKEQDRPGAPPNASTGYS